MVCFFDPFSEPRCPFQFMRYPGKSMIANALVLRPTSLVLRQRPRPPSYVLRPTQNCQLSFCLVLYVLQDSSFWTATKKDEIDCSAISRQWLLSSLLIIVRLLSSFSLTADTITAYTLLVPLSHCQHISRPPQSLPTHFSSPSVTANTFLVPLSHCLPISRPTAFPFTFILDNSHL